MSALLALLVADAAATCSAVADGRYALGGATTYGSGYFADSLAVGDLDGDGDDDVVLGIGLGGSALSVRPYLQSGGTLTPLDAIELPPVSVSSEIGSVALGDVDEDGDLDVATNTIGGVYLFYNDGVAGLGEPVPLGGTADRAVRLLDVDADGHLDVLALAGYAVHVAWGDGTGRFAAPAELFEMDGIPDAVEIAHVGGGSGPDILLSESANDGLTVWHDDGARRFTFASSHALADGWAGSDVGVGDLDGDGDTDAVCSGGGNRPVNLSLFYQESGGFGPLATLGSYDNPDSLVVADVDIDGLDDVVVTHGGWGCVGVYLQESRGLGAEDLYEIPNASGYDSYGVAVGDLDGDACTDVVIADYESGLVVLAGNGCEDRHKDTDGDGVPDVSDVCDDLYDPSQGDRDFDGVGDVCDGCPSDADDGTDTDADGVPDACDLCPGADDRDGCGPDTDTDLPGDTALPDRPDPPPAADGGCGCAGGAGSGAWLLAMGSALRRRRGRLPG